MNSKFIDRLKEFYLLETFQVAYYRSQLSTLTGAYNIKAFDKIIAVEESHAQYFASIIEKAKLELPTVSGTLFEFAGEILGESAKRLSTNGGLKLGIKLEQKAAETYRDFIAEAKTFPVIHDTLMEYLLDEEFHLLWLKDYVRTHPR